MPASLMYHDIVPEGDCDASGFPGPSAASYKFAPDDFSRHIQALASTALHFPRVDRVRDDAGSACLLTFDDGGSSAIRAANVLDRYAMVGHFLVTGSRIGTPGFLDESELRALVAAGHIVGSHSHTHPGDISRLGREAIVREWQESVERLSQIIGEPIDVGSVPGGFYSTTVARAAGESGIRHLFTSEPTDAVKHLDGCRVLGRYALQRGATPRQVVALAAGDGAARARQWLLWNAKKPVKRFVGPAYRWLRWQAFGGA